MNNYYLIIFQIDTELWQVQEVPHQVFTNMSSVNAYEMNHIIDSHIDAYDVLATVPTIDEAIQECMDFADNNLVTQFMCIRRS